MRGNRSETKTRRGRQQALGPPVSAGSVCSHAGMQAGRRLTDRRQTDRRPTDRQTTDKTDKTKHPLTLPVGGVRPPIMRLAGGSTRPTRSREEDRKSHAMRACSTAHVRPERAGSLTPRTPRGKGEVQSKFETTPPLRRVRRRQQRRRRRRQWEATGLTDVKGSRGELLLEGIRTKNRRDHQGTCFPWDKKTSIRALTVFTQKHDAPFIY